MTNLKPGRRGARTLLLSAGAVCVAATAAAPAMAADVTGGKLDWTIENVFDGGVSTVDHTWLGYTTNPTPFAGANGSATPSDGASGDIVTRTSPRGAGVLATFTYNSATGSYEPADGKGTIRFDGTVTFAAPNPPAGHGFTISLEDPKLVLDGDSGQMFTSGVKPSGGAGSPVVPYDDTQAVFNLDLSDAVVSLHADGSRTIAGIVPSIATAELAFPNNYGVGAGPDRTPNTFGSFSIRVKTAPVAGPKGDKGDAGTNGTNGANGRDGAAGKNGTTTVVHVQTSSLAKAPFKGKAPRKIRVTARKSSKTLATGTVKGRSLTVTLATGSKKKQLKGVYVLRLVKGKGAATVRLP